MSAPEEVLTRIWLRLDPLRLLGAARPFGVLSGIHVTLDPRLRVAKGGAAMELGLQRAVPLAVRPTALDFGEALVGTEKRSWVEVRNPGPWAVVVDRIECTGLHFSTQPEHFVVPANSVRKLVVRCQPTEPGVHLQAELHVHTGDIWQATVALSARSAVEPLAASPVPLDLGTVLVGESTQARLSVENRGGLPCDLLSAGTPGAPGLRVLDRLPMVVSGGGAATITVQWTPREALSLAAAALVFGRSRPVAAPFRVPILGTAARLHPRFVGTWGAQGALPGRFSGPTALSCGPDGDLYVAEFYNHRIQAFASDGRHLAMWGEKGTEPGQLQYPTGVAVSPGALVYVADQGNHRVQTFTRDGQYRDSWGGAGTGPGRFRSPCDVAVDSEGFVYVVDRDNHRVQKFDPQGRYLLSWGRKGRGYGQFMQPRSIAVAQDGRVVVADSYLGRVQAFDRNGTALGGPLVYVRRSREAMVREVGVTTSGRILVVDRNAHTVAVHGLGGRVLARWGREGTLPGQFRHPAAVAGGPGGRVYVADFGNDRICVFELEVV